MSINNGFLFPFVLAVWGAVGFGQMALFDLGHVLGQSLLVYAIAATYGGRAAGFRRHPAPRAGLSAAVGAGGGAAAQCLGCSSCRMGW